MVVGGARRFNVDLAARVQQREVALAVLGPLVLVLQPRQPQHRLARRRVFAVRQTERLAAQAKLSRIGARQRPPLRAILVLDWDRCEPVARDQYVFEDRGVEGPVVRYEFMLGGIGERRRYRVAGPPRLHLAVVDCIAEKMYAGARIGRVDVRAALLQFAAREGLGVPDDDGHRGKNLERDRIRMSARPPRADIELRSYARSEQDLVVRDLLRRGRRDGLRAGWRASRCRRRRRSDLGVLVRGWQRT